MFAATLVYTAKRSGELTLDGRPFILRRVPFPDELTAEWFVVDLLQHHGMAGASLAELEQRLTETLRSGRWKRGRLHEIAALFGNKTTKALVDRCIRAARLMPGGEEPLGR
jgi:hypothetical protein